MGISIRDSAGRRDFDDPDDPIVWRRSALLPDGRFRILTLHQSARDGLLAHFGRVWLDAYLSGCERELLKWGVH